MGTKYPYSGLTDQQETVLDGAGWTETGLESLPPPWTDPERSRFYGPEDAYAECVRRLRATMDAAKDVTP